MHRPRLFGQPLPSQVLKLTNMDLMMKTCIKINSYAIYIQIYNVNSDKESVNILG